MVNLISSLVNMRKEDIFSRRRGCQLKFLIKLKPSSSIFTAPGFISSEAARDLKPITAAASDPGSSLQSKAWHPSLFLSFFSAHYDEYEVRTMLWIFRTHIKTLFFLQENVKLNRLLLMDGYKWGWLSNLKCNLLIIQDVNIGSGF